MSADSYSLGITAWKRFVVKLVGYDPEYALPPFCFRRVRVFIYNLQMSWKSGKLCYPHQLCMHLKGPEFGMGYHSSEIAGGRIDEEVWNASRCGGQTRWWYSDEIGWIKRLAFSVPKTRHINCRCSCVGGVFCGCSPKGQLCSKVMPCQRHTLRIGQMHYGFVSKDNFVFERNKEHILQGSLLIRQCTCQAEGPISCVVCMARRRWHHYREDKQCGPRSTQNS